MSFFSMFGQAPPSGNPYAAYAIYDSFTDANDTALTSHVPEQKPAGAAWTDFVGIGGFTIQGNAASDTGPTDQGIIIESGVSDGTISVSNMVLGKDNGLPARCTTWQNGIMVEYSVGRGKWEMYRLQGAYNPIGTDYVEAHSAGDVITTVALVLSGSSISFVLNGVERISATDTYNQTETKHGLFGYAEIGQARWGLFSVA